MREKNKREKREKILSVEHCTCVAEKTRIQEKEQDCLERGDKMAAATSSCAFDLSSSFDAFCIPFLGVS